MKFKRGLVRLSLLSAVFAGFCVFGNVSEAKLKNVGSNKVEKVFSAGVVDAESVEEKLNDAETRFYEDGLNKCENKPVFCAEVFEHVFGHAFRVKGRNNITMTIKFSPTFLKKKHSAFEHGLKNAMFEVVDKNKHVCRFTVNDVFSQPWGDIALVYVPDKADLELLNNKEEEGVFDYKKISLDKGFKVAPNEEYIIRIYDSAGELAVEDRCVSVFESDDEFSACRAIAHPKKFDKDFYRGVVSELESRLRNKLGKATNFVFSVVDDLKKQSKKKVVFGEPKSVENFLEVEDEEDNFDE